MRSYTQQTQKCTGSADHSATADPDDSCRNCGAAPLRFGRTDNDGNAVILRHCPECGPYASNPPLSRSKSQRLVTDGGTIRTTSSTTGREQFPQVAARIGEDPARFLDIELSSSGIGTGPFALAAARIRGLETVATVDAWLHVETELDQGPRKPVIKRLNQRKRQLQDVTAEQAADQSPDTRTEVDGDA